MGYRAQGVKKIEKNLTVKKKKKSCNLITNEAQRVKELKGSKD